MVATDEITRRVFWGRDTILILAAEPEEATCQGQKRNKAVAASLG